MKKGLAVRHPVVSGLFYPDQGEELQSSVDGYLTRVDEDYILSAIRDQTGMENPLKVQPLVLISPHAGFIFSGLVQAHTYRLLKNFEFDTVVIIGPVHQTPFRGISLSLDDVYNTPIGNVAVDLEIAKALISQSSMFQFQVDAHLSEHSIEVQLPFLQRVQPGAKIVPVLFGEQNLENARLLTQALIKTFSAIHRRWVVIVSSDLSHYHSHVEASSLDHVLMEDIKRIDPESLYGHILSGSTEACGFGGILSGLLLVLEAGKKMVSILYYMDSGSVSGDRRRVVGYLSAVLY
ncbi:MAG: AmmeMemoRadiSam system protein B [Spirochaetota bacterium]